MNNGERIVKKFLQKFGILIRKYTPGSSEELRRTKLFAHHEIDMVFDIGANKGQYAKGIMDNGYTGHIVSFEPLSAVHQKLSREASGHARWTVADRCAVGSNTGEAVIHIAANSVSSTLSNMLSSHTEGAPESAIVSSEKVQVETLDHLAAKYAKKEDRLFIKIDVEGFEEEVLKGGQDTLARAIGVEMEISIVPLYENQNFLLPVVLNYMQEKGFTLVSITTGFTDFKTGEVLQCNGIFYRKKR